jgi:translation elongation factor EF-G
MTRGRGTFSSSLDHYEEVPQHLAEKVIESHRKETAEAGAHH